MKPGLLYWFLLILPGIFILPSTVSGEGTKEIMPNAAFQANLCIDATRNQFALYNGDPDYRLFINVKDHFREIIYFGFGPLSSGSLVYRIHNPLGIVENTGNVPIGGQRGFINTYTEAVTGPNVLDPAGYNALSVAPTMNGDYYITFQYVGNQDERDFEFFDITVVDDPTNIALKGRVFSKAWQFWTIVGITTYLPFYGKMYIYSKDSIVTQFDPNGFDGREFSFASNESGCYPISALHPPQEARQSRAGEHTYPQYKIFLNDPDPIVYPSGNLGGVDTTYPIGVNSACTGITQFVFKVTKDGNAQILIQLSALGPPYADRIIQSPVTMGFDTITWDGYDGAIPPHQVPNGARFPFVLSYLNGMTHLPLFDVENNTDGFKLALVRPMVSPPPPQPAFYWDDSRIYLPNVNLTGCISTPTSGCHLWELGVHNYQHDQTVNTWWYVISKTFDPIYMVQRLNQNSSQSMTICNGDSVLIGGVYRKTAGIYLSPDTSRITGCDSTAQVTLAVNPTPVVELGPDVLVCQGQSHTFDAGPGLKYSYAWDDLTTGQFNIGTGQTYTTAIAGTYRVRVTNATNCTKSDTVHLIYYPQPAVSLMICADNPTVTDASPFPLKGGLPLGGGYLGPGVTPTGYFDPALAGPGIHNIRYFYTNMYGCSDTAVTQISVIASTGPFPCGSLLTDVRDNQKYTTVLIGTQCWMSVNLNYGTVLNSSHDQRDNCIPEKFCFQDNPNNCILSGGLYQWDELMKYMDTEGSQGLCPPAWHVPTESDWAILFNYYINSAHAGGELKSTGTSGFNALFPGLRFINKSWSFNTFATHFWSSTRHGNFKGWAHGMNRYDPGASYYPSYRVNAFPVRCIKD